MAQAGGQYARPRAPRDLLLGYVLAVRPLDHPELAHPELLFKVAEDAVGKARQTMDVNQGLRILHDDSEPLPGGNAVRYRLVAETDDQSEAVAVADLLRRRINGGEL